MESFAAISDALQNPKSEGERLAAWSALKEYMNYTESPSREAFDLYFKYGNRLERDWTKEVVSI